MARRRSPILWLVAATVVVAVAWFVVTPRRAWHDFLRALAQDDRAVLAAVTDFPAIREHATADFTVALAEQFKTGHGVPENLRPALIEQMVNSMATRAGLLQLVNSFSVTATGNEPARTSFRYRGIMRVDVLLGGSGPADSGAGLFTFERSGTHWRLIRASSQSIAALTSGR